MPLVKYIKRQDKIFINLYVIFSDLMLDKLGQI